MPHVVTGVLKDYPWGVTDGLARWHGPTGAAQAELWFGAHPAGASHVVEGPDVGRTLADLPEHQGMPLVKLLCAGSPLSIQVHPDEALAREGWSAGSPLFADDAEKSEVLVALEPFDVHVGWRDAASAADVLAHAGAPASAVSAVREGRHADAARALLTLRADERGDIVSGLVAAAERSGWSAEGIAALARVVSAYPADSGVLVTVLLDHARLLPGQALAVPAGVVHSYVGGLAVEVMTSSDNVLRLGLTGKPIAVDHALAAVRSDRSPQRIDPDVDGVVTPAGMPFDVVLAQSPRTLATGRHRVVVALDGDVDVSMSDGVRQRLSEGRALVWSPHEPDARVEPLGRAVVVTGA